MSPPLAPACQPDRLPRSTSAAIDSGVVALGVLHVIVLGQSFCAGIRGA
jgi:carbonic anhydrase